MFQNSVEIELPSHDRIWLYDPAHKVQRLIDRSGRLPILPDGKYSVTDGDTPPAEKRRPQGAR